MKPRTRQQREVQALSDRLPGITARQKEWAFGHAFGWRGLVCKGEAWCTACGAVWTCGRIPLEIDLGATATCPVCGRQLKLERRRTKRVGEWSSLTVPQTRGRWQVFRHFELLHACRKGGRPEQYAFECVQQWVSDTGGYEVVARPTTVNHCSERWDYHKPLTLKDWKGVLGTMSYTCDPHKYDIIARVQWPMGGVLRKARERGYSRVKGIGSLAQAEMVRAILCDREAEELARNGQTELFRWKLSHCICEYAMPCQRQIRLARRHGYEVSDAQMWMDYIGLLEHFGRDTHSPRYLFPADLKAEHDRLLARKREQERRQAEAERVRRMEKEDARYRKAKARYLGIAIEGAGISVRVLQSVPEFHEEGEAMHHCVYQQGYYHRPDSLILTARDSEGRRLETVEVSLRSLKVVQCHGKCNQNTPRHDEIVRLVESHMGLIREAKENMNKESEINGI